MDKLGISESHVDTPTQRRETARCCADVLIGHVRNLTDVPKVMDLWILIRREQEQRRCGRLGTEAVLAVWLFVAVVVGHIACDCLPCDRLWCDDIRWIKGLQPRQCPARIAFQFTTSCYASNESAEQTKRRRRPLRRPARSQQAVVTVIEETDGEKKVSHSAFSFRSPSGGTASLPFMDCLNTFILFSISLRASCESSCCRAISASWGASL